MKNKEITIYELYTKIYKNENIPQRIKFENKIYFWDGDRYLTEDKPEKNLLEGIVTEVCLHDKVKILDEENDEFEDIEEIGTNTNDELFTMQSYVGIPERAQDWNFDVLKEKINQLIRNQKKIIERLKKDV